MRSAVELFGCVYYPWNSISAENWGKMLRYDTQNDTWSEIAGILSRPHSINLFKAKNALYATALSPPSNYTLYKYDIDRDVWNWVRVI